MELTKVVNELSRPPVSRASMLNGRKSFAAAPLGGKIFAIGGNLVSGFTNINEEFDPNSNTWTAKANMILGSRSILAAAALAGRIHVIGGNFSTNQVDRNEEFDPGVAKEFANLAPNTLYTFRAKARNQTGLETTEVTGISTCTLPGSPITTSSSFAPIGSTSFTLNFALAGSPGCTATTEVRVVVSTESPFTLTVNQTSWGVFVSTGFTGLTANTSYYVHIQARRDALSDETTFIQLNSTTTAIETPDTLYFGVVSTYSIQTAIYEPTPSFTNLGVLDSAANISCTGGGTCTGYSGWNAGADAWVGRSVLPLARSFPAIASNNDKLYVSGGAGAGCCTTLNNNYEYDAFSDAWITRAVMLSNRSSHRAVSLEGRIFAIGGNSGSMDPTNFNDEYNPVTNTWTPRAAMPDSRMNFGAAALGGLIYAVGGWNGSVLKDESYVFDPVLNFWTPRAPLLSPRRYFGVAAWNNSLFAIGGNDSGQIATTINEEYNPTSNTWTTRSAIPKTMARHAVVQAGTKIYAIGGINEFSNIQNVNFEFDPSANVWTTLRAIIPTSRRDMGVGFALGKVYAVGGFSGSELTTNEEYNTGTAGSFTGLTPNTQYILEAKARNQLAVETPASTAISTYTLAAVPVIYSTGALFSVQPATITVSWRNGGNPTGTSFYVELSTANKFDGAGDFEPGWLDILSYEFTGLIDNTSYYARVKARNELFVETVYLNLGSSVTPIVNAAYIYFDEITTHSILAGAYGPAPGFTRLQDDLSAVALYCSPTDGDCPDGYAPWNVGGNAWTTRAPYPFSIRFHPVAAVGGKVYAVGGNVGGTGRNYVTEFDPMINTWTTRAPSPHAIYRNAATALNGKLYTIGGENAAAARAYLSEFDPALNTWTTRAPNLETIYAIDAAVLEERIHIVGGFDNTNGTNFHTEFNPAANTWTTRAPNLYDIYDYAAEVSGGKLYSIGGINSGARRNFNSEFDPIGNTWTTRAPASPGGYDGHTVASLAGKLYLIAGLTTIVENATNEFDPAINTWTTRRPYLHTIHDLDAVALKGKIYAMGGLNSGSGQPFHVEFDPGTAEEFANLTPNTEYTFKAKSRNRLGVETAETVPIATYTLAALPISSAILNVERTSYTVNWAMGGNPAGTNFLSQISTDSAFSGASDQNSGWVTLVSHTFTGVAGNTLWFAQVKARNTLNVETDYISLGSTGTRIETPTSVYFDEISSYSITAAAYSPAPGFSNLQNVPSGINIAEGGAYAGWTSGGNTWTTRAPMSLPRRYVTAIAKSGKLYAIGGFNGTEEFNRNEEYDPASNTWTTRAVMPSPRHSSRLGMVSGKIYALGGANNGIMLAHNEAFDPLFNTWTTRALMLSIRVQFAAAVIEGKIFTVGGFNVSPGDMVRSEEFDPVLNTWTTRAPLPSPRQSLAGAVFSGKFYAIGGSNAGFHNSSTEFNPVLNTWTTRAPFAIPRSFLSGAALGGKIYISGGDNSGALDYHDEFDPINNTWTQRTALPGARTQSGLFPVKGKLYSVGGSNGVPLTDLLEFNPGLAVEFIGLAPNTQYTFKAKARDVENKETGESPNFSTYTLAGLPVTISTGSFSDVTETEMTVAWSSGNNPSGTQFFVEVSTSSSFDGADDRTGDWAVIYSSGFTGLSYANATYYARARARNAYNYRTAWTSLGSTHTWANPPVLGSLTSLFASSFTVSWEHGTNSSYTEYQITVATDSGFIGADAQNHGFLQFTSTDIGDLEDNHVYFIQGNARDTGGRIRADGRAHLLLWSAPLLKSARLAIFILILLPRILSI